MKKKINVLVLCLAVFSVLFMAGGAGAREFRIFDEVWLVQEQECKFIEVRFNVPMRYIKHFPFEEGEDLRIQLEPLIINPSEESARFRREYPGSVSSELGAIADVVFEGDVDGGPFLSLYFHDPVSFKVGQGADFRSLVISVARPEDSPCDPMAPLR
jgi:hypothetical protein